ncbi:MAG TPA: cbb3-type cytochrome c oxidase subunit 3 [Burkholderiaceae bacterium]|nr:cbb3-type cytochrome c oxidase subunit 3 [Burkholderiaceae bacterium]
MDFNTYASLFTVLCFTLFIALLIWNFLPSRRERLERYARALLEEESTASDRAHMQPAAAGAKGEQP